MHDFQSMTDTAVFSEQNSQFSELLTRLSQLQDNPTEGLAGYLVTEDPTYLPDDPDIKILVRLIGRDKLLRLIITRAMRDPSFSEEV